MWHFEDELKRLRERGLPAVLVTVIRTAGSTPRQAGAKMIVAQGGTTFGTIGGGQLEYWAIRDALECLKLDKCQVLSYALTTETGQCCGGRVELFMETLNSNPMLTVFGAGHVAQALARVLVGTSFNVSVADSREKVAGEDSIPPGVTVSHGDTRAYIESVAWSATRSYAIVMTHSHAEDFEILRRLLECPLRYLGMIGSTSKWKQFRRRLLEAGIHAEALDAVRCPVGIARTGQAPAEIAISIAAAVLADFHGKDDHHSVGLALRCGEASGDVPS